MHFERVLELEPRNMEALYSLGRSHELRNSTPSDEFLESYTDLQNLNATNSSNNSSNYTFSSDSNKP